MSATPEEMLSFDLRTCFYMIETTVRSGISAANKEPIDIKMVKLALNLIKDQCREAEKLLEK